MAAAVEESSPFGLGNLTASEAALYDRQIRLWGLDAQNRIRASDVLIVGLGGLGAEVAKNLILAGPRSVTLMDHNEVSGVDAISQFLLQSDNNSANRAEASKQFCLKLNPLVKLEIVTEEIGTKGPSFFKKFTLVVLIDQDHDIIEKVNAVCRKDKIAFIAGGVFGWAGYGFFDFSGREFLVKKPKIDTQDLETEEEAGPSKANVETVTIQDENEKVKKAINFASFAEAFSATTKGLKARLRMSVPRSYFLIRALLMRKHELGVSDEVLEQTYNALLEETSHFPANDENEIYRDFRLFTGPQLGPACAILGGFISQEAIKAMSLDGEPLQNVLLYTALDTAYVCNMPPRA